MFIYLCTPSFDKMPSRVKKLILAHKFLFLVYALLKWFKDFFVSLVESVTCFKLLNWLTYCMNTWVCRISMIVVFALVEWCDCIWIWKWSVLLLHTCIVLENVKLCA